MTVVFKVMEAIIYDSLYDLTKTDTRATGLWFSFMKWELKPLHMVYSLEVFPLKVERRNCMIIKYY